jgi:hypothetical protein
VGAEASVTWFRDGREAGMAQARNVALGGQLRRRADHAIMARPTPVRRRAAVPVLLSPFLLAYGWIWARVALTGRPQEWPRLRPTRSRR